MNTVELTDEELAYLYTVASKVIAIGGRVDRVDEAVFQKLYDASRSAGEDFSVPFDLSEHEISGYGFGKVVAPRS